MKFLLLLICGLLGSPALAGAAGKGAPAGPKHEYTNVILLSLQCLRADHLGAYGYRKKGISPNIDAMAKKSVLFENAIAQANFTPIAQMSMLTSQYPRVNGMISFEVPKENITARTLPEILKYYGYTTAATVSSPEFFMRFDTEAGEQINPGDIFARGYDYFGRTARGPGGSSLRVAPTGALDWLKENKDKKFFLWIASGLLHMPYAATVPEPDKSIYDPPGYTPFWQKLPQLQGKYPDDAPAYDIFSRVYQGDFYWDFQPIYRLSRDDVDYVIGRYDAGVHYTDRFVGELLKTLENLQLTEKTLIVLQSMHGDDLGENGLFFHYDISEPVVKNALLIRFPGQESAGRRVKDLVRNLDVTPTILSYLDIPPPHDAQGESLLPLIRGRKKPGKPAPAFIDRLPWWEYTLSKWYLDLQGATGKEFSPAELRALPAYREKLKEKFAALGYPPGDIAIRTDRWKLILRQNHELLDEVSWWSFITGKTHKSPAVELYDLQNDPLEQHNVAAKHPATVAELRKSLGTWDAAVDSKRGTFVPSGKRLIIPYP